MSKQSFVLGVAVLLISGGIASAQIELRLGNGGLVQGGDRLGLTSLLVVCCRQSRMLFRPVHSRKDLSSVREDAHH
jgi:hypothetical protein